MYPVSPSGVELRALILDKAKTKAGFVIFDAAHIDLTDSAIQWVCRSFVKSGFIYPAKIRGVKAIRYFATAEAAKQYQIDTPPVVYKTKKQRESMARKLTKPVIKPKPIKAPPKPKAPAEIIYPPGYRLTIIPTPPPRFQVRSHSFIHNG